MAQQTHVEVGDSPVDLTSGLSAGCHIAQVRGGGDYGVLYATATRAPADDDDWFHSRPGEYFTFVAGGTLPTWAKACLPDLTYVLAIASYG